LPARRSKQRRKPAPAAPRGVAVRLLSHVALEASAAGDIALVFDGRSVAFGRLSPQAVAQARGLRTGLPLALFAAPKRSADKDVDMLVRRLAARGLIEYRLGHLRGGGELAVIEPQVPDYWPAIPRLRDTDTLVLSRFAYLRRRADEMVLESPRAGALFKISDAKIAALLATLATPQKIKTLRQQPGFPGVDLLALLLDAQILFKVGAKDQGLRPTEGDGNLVLWDFHDLLFHARSTEGRHANPVGGLYSYVDVIAPQPAVRPDWPGDKIDLRRLSAGEERALSPAAKLFNARRSTRDFDDRNPITLAELSRFLGATARVSATVETPLDPGADPAGGGPTITHTVRPYPSGGASYELELYLAVNICDGLPRGFYHYDAGAHALVPIAVRNQDFNALLNGAEFAMGISAAPQILITIAARFGRVSWKYSSIAYSLILKDTGVLMQTLYLMAADMGLGGCAIGTTNIDLFAKMTGLDLHVEGAVGQFALGRSTELKG
jgi:SagB-type dehydrogenase family enzyme